MYGYPEGPGDRVVVEGDVVRYLLWGNEIANWNRAKGTLMDRHAQDSQLEILLRLSLLSRNP